MSAVPLQGDPGENQTILKFIMSINASSPDKVRPYMSQITVVCLMLLTDSRCNNEVDEAFKMLTASFIKNVIMSAGDEFVQQLQTLEGQMSEEERTTLQKYMATAWKSSKSGKSIGRAWFYMCVIVLPMLSYPTE